MSPTILAALALSSGLAAQAEDPLGPTGPPVGARVVEQRPLTLLLSTGFGAPTGLQGGIVGYVVVPGISVEVGGGMGATGIQASVMARWLRGSTDSPRSSLLVGAGPSMGFLSEDYGYFVPHRDDIEVGAKEVFTAAWMNAEVGWEFRAHVGFVFRTAIGVAARLHDGMSHLCEGVEHNSEDNPPHEGCDPPHTMPGPNHAGLPLLPYYSMDLGWSF